MLNLFACCTTEVRVAADAEPLLCPGRCCASAVGGGSVAASNASGHASPTQHISLRRFSPRSWRSRRQGPDGQALLSRHASAPAGQHLPICASQLLLLYYRLRAAATRGLRLVAALHHHLQQFKCAHLPRAGSLAPRQHSASPSLSLPHRQPRQAAHPAGGAAHGSSSRPAAAHVTPLQSQQQQQEAAELAAQRSRLLEPWQAARRRSR